MYLHLYFMRVPMVAWNLIFNGIFYMQQPFTTNNHFIILPSPGLSGPLHGSFPLPVQPPLDQSQPNAEM